VIVSDLAVIRFDIITVRSDTQSLDNCYYLFKNSELITYLHLSVNNWPGFCYLDLYIILLKT